MQEKTGKTRTTLEVQLVYKFHIGNKNSYWKRSFAVYGDKSECASYIISIGCLAVRPVPSFMWWRHEVPGAEIIVSSFAFRTAGKSTISPIFWERS